MGGKRILKMIGKTFTDWLVEWCAAVCKTSNCENVTCCTQLTRKINRCKELDCRAVLLKSQIVEQTFFITPGARHCTMPMPNKIANWSENSISYEHLSSSLHAVKDPIRPIYTNYNFTLSSPYVKGSEHQMWDFFLLQSFRKCKPCFFSYLEQMFCSRHFVLLSSAWHIEFY